MQMHQLMSISPSNQHMDFRDSSEEEIQSFPIKKPSDIKGQLLSEWLFDVLNFPKTNAKIWNIYALESKKWLNHKYKGTLLFWRNY